MDELYGTKPWVQPLAVAASNLNNTDEESLNTKANKSKYIHNCFVCHSYIIYIMKL